MSGAAVEVQPPTKASPRGAVAPRDEHALRAQRALAESRHDDAERLLAKIDATDSEGPAWRAMLGAELALAGKRIEQAELLSWQAAAWALGEAVTGDDRALRLAARAMEFVGLVCRRRDNLHEALRAHEKAYELRLRAGSVEERWESGMSIAVDEELAGRRERAIEWFGLAVELAGRAEENADRLAAKALTKLAECCIEHGAPERAVEHARRAIECLRRSDPGSMEAARAELLLGHALLMRAAGGDGGERVALLDQALGTLGRAHDELLAFGAEAHADVLWCAEQRDFAERLRAAGG